MTYSEEYGAVASEWSPSENNQRHFYEHWAELISAESWADVPLGIQSAQQVKA